MPGGAPLKASSKRPCKYGPRVGGLCPKKPKSSSTSSKNASGSKSKPRAACKYGPRVNGLCPKKPKAPAKEKVRKYATVQNAAREAVRVSRSGKATTSQKREAVRQVAIAGGTEIAKGIAREGKAEVKKQLRTKAGKELVAKATAVGLGVAKAVGRASVPVAVATGAIVLAARGIESSKRKDARKAAERELSATEKRLGGQRLTAAQRAALLKQYEEFYYKKPITNSFSGK